MHGGSRTANHRSGDYMKGSKQHDKLLTEILEAFFRKAEKENLNKEILNECDKAGHYIFKKNPKHKEKECFICKDWKTIT